MLYDFEVQHFKAVGKKSTVKHSFYLKCFNGLNTFVEILTDS